MRLALILLIVLSALLFVFNPGMDDFREFVRTNSERVVLQETGDSDLGRVLSGAAAAVAGTFVDQITDRSNYYLFSLYTMDLDGADEAGNEWRFLGIGGQFIELERPEALEAETTP